MALRRLGLGAALLTAACVAGPDSPAAPETSSPSAAGSRASSAAGPQDPVLIGAGDISRCSSAEDEATAALVARLPEATVFTTGDNVYPDGTAANYADCYEPTWGAFKDRTRPAAGNHDYHTPGARAYFDYFGAAAGAPEEGWYSYDLGSWHVAVLNSNCDEVGGCGPGSPQERWLRADLAAHPGDCTLAYWHHPRFSSARHGNHSSVEPFWRALYQAGADAVLNGHDHDYEVFAPQDPAGAADPRGIREFVVGTGGARPYRFDTVQPNSVSRSSGTAGVLRLTLHPGSYDWEFLPVAGGTYTDAGSADCVTR